MMPGRLVANDVDYMRMKRLLNCMSAYLQSYEQNFADDLLVYKRCDAEYLPEYNANQFDR